MKDQNTNMSDWFLLDDDSTIHFTIDDISGFIEQNRGSMNPAVNDPTVLNAYTWRYGVFHNYNSSTSTNSTNGMER